jgi:predicted Zn-dependent protease
MAINLKMPPLFITKGIIMAISPAAESPSMFTDFLDTVLPRNPVTKNREFRLVPESVEIALGSALYGRMVNSEGGEYSRRNYSTLVADVGQKLAERSDRAELPFQFTVIDSSVVNAWCLPGGKVAFYRGLIEKMDQENDDFGVGHFTLEEKVAAVMGHEITHATARHSAKSLEFGAFITVVLATIRYALRSFVQKNELADEHGRLSVEQQNNQSMVQLAKFVDSFFGVFYDAVKGMIVSCSGREREFEADKYGMVYLKRAGYRPEAAIWLQEFFAKQQPKSESGFVHWVTHLFSTHPHAEDRAAQNRETLKEINAGTLV